MTQLIVGDHRVDVRGILFDKDGTLLQFISLWGNWAEIVMKRFREELQAEGADLPESPGYLLGVHIDGELRVSSHDRFGPLAMGSPTQMIAIATYYLYRAGVPWNEAMRRATDVFEYANSTSLDHVNIRPVGGVEKFLEQCRAHHLRTGVVTADDKEPSIKHLTMMGIRDYFDSVVGDDCVAQGKPYPDMVELACRELQLQPHEVVVIGDSIGDLEMGRSAGCALTIFIDEEERFAEKPESADVMIRSFAELSLV